MKRVAFLLFLAASLAAVPASAAVRCVNTTGAGGCYKTIQAAVTAAAGLDTVSIAPGTYFENVTVPPGKDGLKIFGVSKTGTIIDPSPNSATGFAETSEGLYVHSNNVQVKNFTIRNGNYFQIRIAGHNALIQYMRLIAGQYGSIYIENPYTGTQILNNELRSVGAYEAISAPDTSSIVIKSNFIQNCDQGCIDVFGDNAVISSNTIHQSEDGEAVSVHGDGAIVTSNLIQGSDVSGISIVGNNATVLSNRVSDTFSDGIGIAGYGSTVKLNTVSSARSDGIYVSTTAGGGGTVASNVVTNAGGYGIFVTGGNPVVNANRVSYTTDDGVYVKAYESASLTYSPAGASANVVVGVAGSGVYADGSELTSDRNQVRDSTGLGMDLLCRTCAASSVSYNLVANTGQNSEGISVYLVGSGTGSKVLSNTVSRAMGYAFFLTGAGAATVTGNKALDQGGDTYEAGFYVAISSSTFTSNTALRCSENGFWVVGSNNHLQANIVLASSGNGFDIAGSNNTLTGNRSQYSAGAGFAVTGGTGNSLTGLNVGGLNRTDYCDDGTGATQTGNAFTSTAPSCDINK
jgi:hypothetical protein